MEDLLRPASTSRLLQTEDKFSLNESARQETSTATDLSTHSHTITRSDDALEILKSKPHSKALKRVLKYLLHSSITAAATEFDILKPSPKASQLVNILVTVTIADYWPAVSEKIVSSELQSNVSDGTLKQGLVEVLRSVTGIGRILAQLQSLIATAKDGKTTESISQQLSDLVDVLGCILSGKNFLSSLWTAIHSNPNLTSRTLQCKELEAVLTSGRIVAISAQALDICNASSSDLKGENWITVGKRYSTWMGMNIVNMALAIDCADQSVAKFLGHFLGGSLRLGYNGKISLLSSVV
jgi:hypothetical protein